MKFNVNYTFSDFYEMQKAWYKHSNYKWVMPLVGIFFTFVNILTLQIDNSFVNYFLILIGIAFIFYQYTFMYIASYFAYRRSTTLHRKTEFDITSSGVQIKTSVSNVEFKWEAFRQYIVNKKVILLSQQKYVFQIIPLRCLSEQNKEELLKLLKEKIKQ